MNQPISFFSGLIGLLFCLPLCAQTPEPIAKEWENMGKNLAQLLEENNEDLDYYFDVSSFWKRVLVSNPVDPNIRRLNEDILKEIGSFSIHSALNVQPETYTFKFLCHRPDSVLVIRQWDDDEGFNYLLLKLDYLANRWKVVDIYTMTLGCYLSKQIKNTVYMPRILRLLGDERSRQYLANAEIYLEAALLFREQEYERAYTKISGIPLQERQNAYQRFKINVAIALVDENKLERSVTEFRTRFPEDKSLPIVLLDYYIVQEQFDKAISSITAIQEAVGDDAYLHYQKSLLHQLERDYKSALEEVNLALKTEPELETYHLQLFELYAQMRQRKKAIAVLDYLSAQYDYSSQDLYWWVEGYYPRLYKSGIFKRWYKARQKKTAPPAEAEEAAEDDGSSSDD